MKGGSPAYDRVNALYSKDCLTDHTNEVDFSQYNTSPKASLSTTYGVGYATTGGAASTSAAESGEHIHTDSTDASDASDGTHTHIHADIVNDVDTFSGGGKKLPRKSRKSRKSRKMRRSRRRSRKSRSKSRRKTKKRRSKVKRGGRVLMPARYYNPNNFETYKGGGLLRDMANAMGYNKNSPGKVGLDFVNGQKKLNFIPVGNELNDNLEANPQAQVVQAGGNDWMGSNNSWGSVNTPSMSEAQFRMFNKSMPYMTNEQLAPGAVGGKAACIGDNKIFAANAFNGVPVLGGGGRRRRRRKSRKSRKSRKQSRKRSKSRRR